MKKPRKHCTPGEKVAILRPPLLEREPISSLCDKLGQQEIHAERDRKLEAARKQR